MKRKSVLLFAAAVSCSLIANTAYAASFADVPEASPYNGYIEDLNKRGVTDGIAPGRFGPDQTLTRAQFAKFAASAFGLQDPGGTSAFADIRGHWAEPYIRAAAKAGIVEGTSGTAFSPDQPVTREEAAEMVWRYAKSRGVAASPEAAYLDKPAAWASEAVSTAIGHRWFGLDVSQTAGGWSYRPHDAMSRQEAAALLDLALKELTAKKKAVFVWNTGTFLLDQSEALQYLEQHGINLIFLQVDIDIQAGQYAGFIREAGARGMEVQAMGGGPNWIFPNNEQKLYSLIHWVKSYNAGVEADSRFEGIQLDVEPYTLPNWSEQSDALIGNWRDTISGFVQETKMGTPDLTAGAVLPSWLEIYQVPDGQGGRTTMSEWMIRHLDQTTLMAYRETSEDILSSVKDEMDQADRDGKSVIVAVETMPSSEGPISFFSEGQAVMMRELDKVTETLQNRPSFSGWAIHDYDSWIRLKE